MDYEKRGDVKYTASGGEDTIKYYSERMSQHRQQMNEVKEGKSQNDENLSSSSL